MFKGMNRAERRNVAFHLCTAASTYNTNPHLYFRNNTSGLDTQLNAVDVDAVTFTTNTNGKYTGNVATDPYSKYFYVPKSFTPGTLSIRAVWTGPSARVWEVPNSPYTVTVLANYTRLTVPWDLLTPFDHVYLDFH